MKTRNLFVISALAASVCFAAEAPAAAAAETPAPAEQAKAAEAPAAEPRRDRRLHRPAAVFAAAEEWDEDEERFDDFINLKEFEVVSLDEL